MSAVPAVVLDRVSKRYTIYRRRAAGLKDRVVGRLRGLRDEREEFWALRDVSLAIAPGETLGIIGPNGGGKSTLLQVIAGILQPDGGSAAVQGRVTSLLELGAGFSPDLSGRENIFLNASLHGLGRADIAPKIDRIVEFAELDRFIDMPVRNYSSGMYMRLGIAVAVHLDPEIVLIDEAFAVGDEAFQRKCLRKLKEFQDRGLTIVIVSHDLLLIERMATRTCLVWRGRIESAGAPTEVIGLYHALAAEHGGVAGEHRWGNGEVTIPRIETRDRNGRAATVFRTGEPLTVVMRYEAARRIEKPVFGLGVWHEAGTHLTGPNTRMGDCPIAFVEGAGEVQYHVPALPLLPGRYYLSVSAYDHDLVTAYDHRERVVVFTVVEGGTDERFGYFTLAGSWRLEPSVPSPTPIP